MRVEDQFLYPLFFAFSPVTGWVTVACYIFPFGDVFGYHDYSVSDSYGSPDPRNSTGVYQYCIMQFGDPRAGNYVDFSYGSPNTRYGNSAIDVGINGGVGNDYYAVVDNSYGALRAQIGMIAAIT